MKKNINRIFSFVIALIVVLSLSACGQKSTNDNKQAESTTHEIVDMAGRTLTIPKEVKKVMGNNAMAQNFMYTLAPEKMSSLGSKPSEGEQHFYPDSVKSLPILGDNSGKKVMNPEEVIAAAPDFILEVTMINNDVITKIDELQKKLNIPIVIVSADLADLGKSYRFVGENIGCQNQAEKLATYADKVVGDIKSRAATIPEDKRVKYYYAEGDDGLKTDPSGSDHTRAFDAVGAVNCVSMESYDTYYGRAGISMEEIMKLDPDVIIFCPVDSIFTPNTPSICQDLMDGKEVGSWKTLKAVKEGKFYESPYGLHNAIDRPASVNLLYGCQWLGNILYPSIYDYDMTKVTKEFYSLFYHYDLSDEEVKTILSRATAH